MDNLQTVFAELPDRDAAARLLAEAGSAPSPEKLARQTGVDRRYAALAFVAEKAKAGRPDLALSHVARVGNLTAREPVQALITTMENELPPPSGDAPYVDRNGRPIVFVISFPRSGNSHLVQLLVHGLKANVPTAYIPPRAYFSNRVREVQLPSPVFVKDHAIRDAYANNPIIYQHRDGRDCLLSLNDYQARAIIRSQPTWIDELSDSLAPMMRRIRRADFGLWHDNVDRAHDFSRRFGNVIFSRYDALMGEGGYQHLKTVLGDVGLDLGEEDYANAVEKSRENERRVRARQPQWSRDEIYPDGTMMARWLQGSGSRWRQLLDREDKELLHASGITPTLMHCGYEDDPEWYRR